MSFKVNSYKCPDCEMTFSLKISLEVHQLNHIPNDRVYECGICGKKYHIYSDLKVHIFGHGTKDDGNSYGESDTSTVEATPEKELNFVSIIFKEIFAPISTQRGQIKTFHYSSKAPKEANSNPNKIVKGLKKIKKIRCRLCREEFSLHELLVKHYALEFYHCDICKERFTSCKNFRSHVISHQFACTVCSETFSCKTKLDAHSRIHSEDRTCSICQESFAKRRLFLKHMRELHPNATDVMCDLCGKMCPRRYFKRHMRYHSGEKPFQCKECEKRFYLKSSLNTHMKFHRGERDHFCNICGKGYFLKSKLTDHLRHHTGEKPFECKICSKAFFSSSSLQLHRESHSQEEHTCLICQRKFNRRYALFSHYRTHSLEEIQVLNSDFVTTIWNRTKIKKSHFDCSVCGVSFPSQILLKDHKKVHPREKFQAGGKHKKTHAGEKSHICSVCGKSFRAKSSLTIHTRTHTGERPYQCSVCSKQFVVSDHLRRHMFLHTGEKPYICSVCGKAFNHRTNYKTHSKIHEREAASLVSSPKKLYSCNTCEKTFTSNKEATLHGKSCLRSQDDEDFNDLMISSRSSFEECDNRNEEHLTTVQRLPDMPDLHSMSHVNYIVSEDGKTMREHIVVHALEESPSKPIIYELL